MVSRSEREDAHGMTIDSNASADRIVVGVDESVHARQALQWAVREGQIRGSQVVAVLAWGYLDQHPVAGTTFDPDYDEVKVRKQEQR